MFTGLIEHMAPIASITPSDSAGGFTFTFSHSAPILDDCHIGDSICINGACLTVIAFDTKENGGWFQVGLANETLRRTNLGEMKVGDSVNAERAMAAHTRFGGHIVQGHVDGTATIVSMTPDGNSIRFRFQFPPPPFASTSSTTTTTTSTSPPSSSPSHPSPESLMPYLIEKGYITIDGASLTLTEVNDADRTFGIMLIAHSQTKLTLTGKKVGDKVNVEADCVGKYVLGSQERIERLIEGVVERKMREKGVL